MNGRTDWWIAVLKYRLLRACVSGWMTDCVSVQSLGCLPVQAVHACMDG